MVRVWMGGVGSFVGFCIDTLWFLFTFIWLPLICSVCVWLFTVFSIVVCQQSVYICIAPPTVVCPQGMEAMLKSAVSSSPPEMKSQLNYIIKQLLSNSSGNIIEGVAGDSDGEDDEEDVSSTSVTMVTNHACDSCILGGRP